MTILVTWTEHRTYEGVVDVPDGLCLEEAAEYLEREGLTHAGRCVSACFEIERLERPA